MSVTRLLTGSPLVEPTVQTITTVVGPLIPGLYQYNELSNGDFLDQEPNVPTVPH